MSWLDWAGAEGDRVRRAGQWRSVRSFDAQGPRGRLADGRSVVSFASNDYLGLTRHPAVMEAAHEAVERWGTGSGSARLIVGSRPVHHELEAELADWKQDQAALLFPTGFAANLGVLTVLGGGADRILSDELNHASIIDGTRLARAEVSVFRHRDLDHLAELLRGTERAVVVSDSVFSMDGDLADVEGLVELCRDAGALLVLDEAHAVLGPEVGSMQGTLVRVGTLSKTLGSLGGFVTGPQPIVDLVLNRARSFIFTTALSPGDAQAALAALRVLRSEEGVALRAQLRANVDRLRSGHPSPILPVVVGPEDEAVRAAEALLERGMLVPAIRPPTVAPGTSRLRVALSAAHRSDEVDELVGALTDLGLGERIGAA